MMLKPRIFISHSARDADAREVLERIDQGLESAGFEVMLDRKRLRGGDEWEVKLFTWLKSCDGAVVLFSQNALTSDWVAQESTILNFRLRAESGDGFVLLPVLLPPVQPRGLEGSRLGPLNLRRLQAVTGENAEQLASDVVKIFQERRGVLRGVMAQSHRLLNSLDQAVAATYKIVDGRANFLLVRTLSNKGKERWILPKGRVRSGEHPWSTAQFAAWREAGVDSRLETNEPIVTFEFWQTNSVSLKTGAFLLEATEQFDPDRRERLPSWFTREPAVSMLAKNRGDGRHAKNREALEAVITRAARELELRR
jgi:ADP-ribose pyrophosphatase YjhB (NUDIX family)